MVYDLQANKRRHAGQSDFNATVAAGARPRRRSRHVSRLTRTHAIVQFSIPNSFNPR